MFSGSSIAPPSKGVDKSSFLTKLRSHPQFGPVLSFTSSALRNIIYYGFVPGVLVLGTRTDGAPSLRDLPMKIIIL